MIEFFKALIEGVWRGLVDIYFTLTYKDPCKKCIVRACCSEECEEVIMTKRFLFPHTSIKEKKYWAILYSICIISSIGSLSVIIIRDFIL